MHSYCGITTDLYQLTMAQVYFEEGLADEIAVFDYFFRKLPYRGGYAIFAGLEDLLDILESLHFSADELQYLRGLGFPEAFIRYLEDFRFSGAVYSASEGDLVFPNRPVLQVEAPLIEAQIVETLLLNLLNFQTLIATKASRMRLVAGDRKLIDFGLRRAQGPGGYYASRAAIVGGFDSTSNVEAGKDFDIPVSGTMAHSFIQRYDDELTAFRAYAAIRPDDCVLLVDTYDTLRSGVPNAIIVGKELAGQGHHLNAIRLDSGDLAYLARESRRMLDDAGLHQVQIAASNQLDEFVIKSLLEQEAPFDIFGVGTSLVTGQPDAALDGVYKLSFAGGKPRIKLSESLTKTTLPHKKQVYRVVDAKGQWSGADIITLDDEKTADLMYHPFDPHRSLSLPDAKLQPLLTKVMDNGKRTFPRRSLPEIATYSREQLAKLPPEYKRFYNPHIYKVGISHELREARDVLFHKFRRSG